MVLRLGIVGAGPSGLFLAHRILKKLPGVKINFYERRKSPFGLLRYGVAPDHPEVRDISKKFEYILDSENVRVEYGVKVQSGGSTTLKDLRDYNDMIAICCGMEFPKKLHLPGGQLKNHVTASNFVGWYNADPEWQSSPIDLANVNRVAIIGNGNVALDVARILLKPPRLLVNTDISKAALEALQISPVHTVDIIGRRGPAEVSFTAAELRELLFGLENVNFGCDNSTVSEIDSISKTTLGNRSKARIIDIFKKKFPSTDDTPKDHETDLAGEFRKCNFFFHQTPVSLAGLDRVSSISFQRTKADSQGKSSGNQGSDALTSRSYDMMISSIGFKSCNEIDLPVNDDGTIQSSAGRVAGHNGIYYVAGWASYGARGDLSSTMTNSFMVAEAIVADCHKSEELNRYVKEFSNARDKDFDDQHNFVRKALWFMA